MTEERDNGVILGHHECPDCGSNDNLVVYEKPDGSVDGYCYSPNCISPSGKVGFKSNNELYKTYLKDEYDIRRIDRSKKKVAEDDKPARKRTTKVAKEKKAITPEEKASVHKQSSIKGGGYRNVLDKYNKKLGIRTSFSDSGGVEYRWYPVTEGKTEEGKPNLVGYKKRICATKDFRYVGKGSGDVDLFNQWNCSGNGKRLVLVGGEEDTLAAVQMIEEYRKTSKNAAPVDVVSSSIGEGSIDKQCQLNYDFLDGYESIIISLDADTAGENATEKLIKVLPPSKVKVMQQPSGSKDPSDALQNGDEEQWVRLLYAATKPKIAGIAGSSTIFDDIIEASTKEKIELPPFLNKVNVMLNGGLTMNTFNIIAAQTSIGKSSVTNEILHHLVMNSKAKVGVMSLEASKGVLGEQLLSLHLGKRISSLGSIKAKTDYLMENRDKANEFFMDEDGDDRFFIMDDRSYLSTTDEVFKQIDKLVRGLGVKVLIIDVLSDLMDNLDINAQAEFMGRIKKLIANNEVCIIGIMHMRKEATGKDSDPHLVNEHSIYGSSTAVKSASTVLLMSRDKVNEDEEVRNTTRVTLTKNRMNGITGKCCELYYDHKAHKLHDKDVWSESQIEGY